MGTNIIAWGIANYVNILDMTIVSTSNNIECSEHGDVGMSLHVGCRQSLAFSFTFSYSFYLIFTTCMIFHGIFFTKNMVFFDCNAQIWLHLLCPSSWGSMEE